MRLPRNDLGHLSSVAHQGKHILFGVDSDRAIHYCVKREAPQETALGFRLTSEVLVDLRARADVQTKLDGLEGRHFATEDLFLAAVAAVLGKDVTDKLRPELLRRARQVVVSHWTDWQMLPLPHETADDSVIAFEQEQRLGGLVTSMYDSHKDSALAPVQAVSDGAHLHVFRQSVRGTLLADRFVLDPDAGRLARALEVRFKRSRKRHVALNGANGQELDSRDFRDVDGAFFLEPTRELHVIGRLAEGRFAVVLVPTHEHDRLRWHIFSWDADQRKLRATTLRRTEDTPFDVRDYTIVEGDGEEQAYRQIPGILRRIFDLRDRDGAALEVTGALTAAVHDIQREIEGEDGELQLVKVERRVFLAAVTAADRKLAALAFRLHADGSLAPIETRRVDALLRERNEELQLPSDLLDALVTCHDDTREPPPAPARRGLCFDADDQWVEGRTSIALGGAFTIEMWARAQTPGRDEVVIGHGKGGVDCGLHLAFDHTRGFRFGYFHNDLTTPEPCVDGEWHHWACVNTRDRVRRIFRDGVLLAEDRSATPYRGEGALILGKAHWGGSFNGEIADVRVWRVARSEAEIRADMHRRLTGSELGVVAQWPLEALVAGVVRNTVPRGHDVLVHGAWRRGRGLSRHLADATTPATGYRNDALVAIAERSTYIETLELRTDGDSGGFDFVFWGETVRGATTERVRVPAQIEALAGGWKRATARFTAGVGMTRLRALEISAPTGTWTRLELRNHKLERLVGTVTEATHDDVVTLTELAPEQAAVERVQGALDALETLEAELARRLRWLDETLASDPSARAATVAQITAEVTQLTAETAARSSERTTAEGSLSYEGTLALRAANGINDLYLSVRNTHVDAISSAAGPWETLTVVNADYPGHQGPVCYGDYIALRAHTGKYFIADNTITGERHYYWVTAMYPAIGAYEKWQILDPANLGNRGAVPRGGRVALKSWRSDNGHKFVTSGTSGPWWQKTWCEHDTITRDANFVAVHLSEGPSVAAARKRHADAASRLSSRSADLATAERLAGEALRDRAHVERERATVQAELDALRIRIDGEVAAHLAAAQRLADASLAMPRVTPEDQPLAVLGGLLSFARTPGRPAANASLEGALHLHFPGTDGRLRRCVYDAVSERWDTDTTGNCLRFDGTGAVTIPHDPAFSSSAYTIELWFRWHGGAGIQFLTAKGYEELEIHVHGGMTGGLRFIPAPGIYVDTAASAIRPGAWVHLACVYSARTGEAQIYLDGVAVTRKRSGTASTASASTAPILLGRRSNGDHPFSGQMSELRLWNVALTQEEIVAQMHDPLTGFEPGLAGYWPLRDGAGAGARDLSRGQRHGAVAGPRFYPSTSPMGRSRAGVVPCLMFERAGAVAVPHSAAYSSPSFTVELWMRWSGSGPDTNFLLGKGIEELEIHTGGSVPGGLRFIPARGLYIDTGPDALTTGEWVHVACVFAGDAIVWAPVPGGLNSVACGADGSVWGVTGAGAIYLRAGDDWQLIPGGLTQISVGSASHVWGVSPDHGIYRWTGSAWQQVPGNLKQVSVAADGAVWGVNLSNQTVRWTGDAWQPIAGDLTQITVGSTSEVWGVNAAGDIHRWTGDGWQRIPGSLRHVSVAADGTVCGVNATGDVLRWRGEGNWEAIGRGLKQVSVGSATLLWGVDPGDRTVRGQPGLDDANRAEIYLNGVAMTRRRTDRQLDRVRSTSPLTIGARGDATGPFAGGISEVRLWNVPLTQHEILARMNQPLSGREAGLVGYWPLRDGEGPRALDRSPAANHGTISGPRFVLLDSPRERPPVGLLAPDTVLAGEYDSLEGDGATRQAFLRRFVAWPVGGGVEVVMGRRVDTLELRWLGNAQMNPTLIGYIEGAPPVPSENLTVEEDYNGASSVEFKISEENTTTFTHDLSAGSSLSMEGAVGWNFKGEVGVALLAKLAAEFEVLGQIKGQVGAGLNFLNQHTRTGTSTVTTSETLSLKGEREKVARFPGLGPRFIPKNVGYATVVSTLADIFALRLRGSRRMVSYRMAPVKDVPPDVNTVTFLINPAYTMNGSLDGQVGTNAADTRFYGHVPATRAQYGSQLEASYYRLREAYALKDAIDRSNRKAEMLAINLKSDILDGIDRELQAKNPVPDTKEAIEQQAQQKATGVTEAAAAGMKQRPAPRRIEQVIEDTPKGNIVNSYVWDGDGGLRVQAQSFASSWENVFGGSVNAEFGLGLAFSVRVFAAIDFNAMLGFNLTETLTNATSTTRALELNVSVDCERRDITDNRDRPLYPGEKVDRYRFMSFALEPATDHFTDFFARVVDPEWLRSDDEEARVLRQIDQGRPNKTWRVLHRVTYVERPSRGGNDGA